MTNYFLFMMWGKRVCVVCVVSLLPNCWTYASEVNMQHLSSWTIKVAIMSHLDRKSILGAWEEFPRTPSRT
jgi:hypothetical protein